MKIYKHEYSMTLNELQTFEYEAEEKVNDPRLKSQA